MARIFALIIVIAAVTVGSTLVAQTDTTFTYQGSLGDGGSPASGSYDLDFSLWDADTVGNQIGSAVQYNSLPVIEGLFTVELDFGASAFDNTSRWLEIAVNGNTLSPRQPINRSPYSIQTRGIFVDDNNNVGIGTSTPIYPLHVESDDPISIYGHGTAASGFSTGVSGQSQSTNGHGVFGAATATTGNTNGVWGQSSSTTGAGVYGNALAVTGTNYGLRGSSQSTSGRGVFGWAQASNGLTDGVFGRSNSTSGRGICGWAPASSGTTYGVVGQSDSTDGTGVRGYAAAATGITYGVYGESVSTIGTGVYGEAIASTGTTYGVRGRNSGTSGTGVYGEAIASTGTTNGGRFVSDSSSGTGVYSRASSSNGITYGVRGQSDSPDGFDFYADGAGEDYGSSSSRRWKSNVEPISEPLEKIAQLRGVYFDWDEEHGGHHDLGMIAEEVGKVLPEIVQYEENGIDAIGMDYSKMTPLLVEAVNALRLEKDAEIAAQAMRLTKLERKNAILSDANVALQNRLDSLEQLVEQLVSTAKELPK